MVLKATDFIEIEENEDPFTYKILAFKFNVLNIQCEGYVIVEITPISRENAVYIFTNIPNSLEPKILNAAVSRLHRFTYISSKYSKVYVGEYEFKKKRESEVEKFKYEAHDLISKMKELWQS